MIFRIILNIKFAALRNFVTYFLIFAFMLTVSGCYTTENYRLSEDELREEESEFELLRVVMKDGRNIDLRNSSAQFVPEYLGKKNLIFYDDYDTMRVPIDSLSKFVKNIDAKRPVIQKFFAKSSPIKPVPAFTDDKMAMPDTLNNEERILSDTVSGRIPSSDDTLIYYPTVKIIELDDAKWVTVKKTEFDTWMTILTVAAIVTLLIVLAALLPPDEEENSAKENENNYYSEENKKKEEEKERTDRYEPSYCEVWNLSPPENSLNIPRKVFLQWSFAHPDPDNLTFDIYADKNDPPRVRTARGITGKSYKLGMV
ncbi:MAG: hypothetical protein L0Y76_08830, partial [Ignavibacteria bacterium]|nr:hypothetical protein [Ignavibacteria bacterium]